MLPTRISVYIMHKYLPYLIYINVHILVWGGFMIVVVRKKHILLCILLVFTLIVAFNINDRAKPTISQRNVYGEISNKVVIVDPGHGGIDPGRVGVNGKDEKHINLAISLKLRKDLEKLGAKVIMTRTEDEGLYDDSKGMRIRDKKRQDLFRRTEYASRKDANIFISIHQNSLPMSQSQYYGAQTFYYENSEEGKRLAEIIQQKLIDGIDNGNKREAKPTKSYYILKNTSIPSVIVECGFISNYKEEQELNSGKYQSLVAKNIAKGIKEFLEEGAK